MRDGGKHSPACLWLFPLLWCWLGAQEHCQGMGTRLRDELVRSPSRLPGCALTFSAAAAALAGKCGNISHTSASEQLWARSAGGSAAPDPTDSSPALS